MGSVAVGLPVLTYDTVLFDMSHLLNRLLRVGGGEEDSVRYLDMRTSAGNPTGGLYGAVKSIRGVIARPDLHIGEVVGVWDGRPRGLSSRRLSLLEGYKKRPEVEPDSEEERLRLIYEGQRPLIDWTLPRLGIPVINRAGLEGDDVIAHVVSMLGNRRVLIVSDDKDFYQLVDNRVHVYRPVKDVFVTPEGFCRVSSLQSPASFLVYRAITGDSSDSIPGIPGVGETTALRVAQAYQAQSWFEEFDSGKLMNAALDMIATDSRNKARYLKLLDSIPIVERNYELMCLSREKLPEPDVQAIRSVYSEPRTVNETEIGQFFASCEFRSIVNVFAQWIAPFLRFSGGVA